MIPQRQRNFERRNHFSDGAGSQYDFHLISEPNEVDQITHSPLAVRIKDNLLDQGERWLLSSICARLPQACTPDHLTGIGLFGAAVTFAGYCGTHLSPGFLWLASFGLILHWFGDSLDGSLARYRQIERQFYGHFLDFSVDALSCLLIFSGIGFSVYVRLDAALFALVGYYMLWLFVLLNCQISRHLQLSFLATGPTEFRLILISLNCWMYFAGAKQWHFAGQVFSPYDGVFIGIGVASSILFIINASHVARKLALVDSATSEQEDADSSECKASPTRHYGKSGARG
ncbi:MAG TPA: CDP-alcohol phosphatidyltransferase family protein [Methylocella sp.]|nr:CDP-alcohol phosphatidyltransferase family protein [Methylocella sp.]